MVDEVTKKTLGSIPLLKTKAGPREKDAWPERLKEEYCALIKYVENNKQADNDWFRLESNSDGKIFNEKFLIKITDNLLIFLKNMNRNEMVWKMLVHSRASEV